jgi:hypothetical protein
LAGKKFGGRGGMASEAWQRDEANIQKLAGKKRKPNKREAERDEGAVCLLHTIH